MVTAVFGIERNIREVDDIGSEVIEGACRSFMKDRMTLAGMRWSELGAEAMLELRSIKVNNK